MSIRGLDPKYSRCGPNNTPIRCWTDKRGQREGINSPLFRDENTPMPIVRYLWFGNIWWCLCHCMLVHFHFESIVICNTNLVATCVFLLFIVALQLTETVEIWEWCRVFGHLLWQVNETKWKVLAMDILEIQRYFSSHIGVSYD